MNLLSPSLSSARSGGEGARRAGEEATRFMAGEQFQKEQEEHSHQIEKLESLTERQRNTYSYL